MPWWLRRSTPRPMTHASQARRADDHGPAIGQQERWPGAFMQAQGEAMANEEALTSALARLEDAHRFSGAILIAQDCETVFEQAYGFASRQIGVPNTVATKFHIASVTKMFIAMATLILAEQGRLALHERPGTYAPELSALDKEITLHHLLSHTSGLPEIYNLPNLRFAMQRLKAEQGNLLAYLVGLPLLFRPGEGWSYSSSGFILLAHVMETVTG